MDKQTLTMMANLEKQTGKPFAEWVDLARALGLVKHGEVVAMLKSRHGLGHGYANLVAHSAREAAQPAGTTGDPLEAQYQGRESLRPVYEKIVDLVRQFGPGLEIAPKKAYVSLRRSRQFALVQPSTRDRMDLGLNLKGMAPGGRLEASGSWNSMVTHRVRLSGPGEVDGEVAAWLKQAWEAA